MVLCVLPTSLRCVKNRDISMMFVCLSKLRQVIQPCAEFSAGACGGRERRLQLAYVPPAQRRAGHERRGPHGLAGGRGLPPAGAPRGPHFPSMPSAWRPRAGPLARSVGGARPDAVMASPGTRPRTRQDRRGRAAPQATLLASAAGDAAVKLWSFALRRGVCTLRGAGLARRAQPVPAAAATARCLHARPREACGCHGLVLQARQRPGQCARPEQALRAPFKANSASPLRGLKTLGAAAARARAGHGAGVRGVAFHEAGDFLASASADGCACVWHAAGGACRQALRRAPAPPAARQAALRLLRAQPASACGAVSTSTHPWLSCSRSPYRPPSRAVGASGRRIRACTPLLPPAHSRVTLDPNRPCSCP